MNAGVIIGVLFLLGVFLFCMPVLPILLVILFAIIIPVQVASLLLAVRAVFKGDVTFIVGVFPHGDRANCDDRGHVHGCQYGISSLYCLHYPVRDRHVAFGPHDSGRR